MKGDKKNQTEDDNEIFLSPIEKYSIYNKFPIHLILHSLLLLLTVLQIFFQRVQYSRSQERQFSELFISENDKMDFKYLRHKYLYSLSEIKDHLRTSLDNYNNIISSSFENISYPKNADNTTVKLLAYYLPTINRSKNTSKQYIFSINSSDLGPLEKEKEALEFIRKLISFKVNYTIQTNIPFYFADHTNCYIWKIFQVYDFIDRGHMKVYLKVKREDCDEENTINGAGTYSQNFVNRLFKTNKHLFDKNFLAEYVWLHLITMFVSLLCMILSLKHIYKHYKNTSITKLKNQIENKLKFHTSYSKIQYQPYSQISSTYNEENPFTTDYTNPSKKDKIDKWIIVSIIGNVFQFLGSLMLILDESNSSGITYFSLGLGCFFAFINIGKYMENLENYSAIFITLKKAIPVSLSYLIGVMPIFLGYAFFGISVFWESEYFDCLSKAIATLYAVAVGDSVWLVIHDCIEKDFFIGNVYIYSFCILFIMIIINLFYSLMSESYANREVKKHQHWIFSFLRIETRNDINVTTEFDETDKGYFPVKGAEDNDQYVDTGVTESNVIESVGKLNRDFSKLDNIIGIIAYNSSTKEKMALSDEFTERFNNFMDNIKKLRHKVELVSEE